MEEFDNKERREDIFSRAIRAGKRTYFFDVKATRADEYYLTITESKRRFNNEHGKFYYEKHKLFLYKEDFDKFSQGLKDVIDFIETGKEPVIEEKTKNDEHADIEFDDLTSDTDTKEDTD
ncbi:MAG: PUR family DNA/RNA-binding protein [Bacteroidales bacterium]|nr:PUR family DNA/RNA-binding protein [Bacteroidales bacterium]